MCVDSSERLFTSVCVTQFQLMFTQTTEQMPLRKHSFKFNKRNTSKAKPFPLFLLKTSASTRCGAHKTSSEQQHARWFGDSLYDCTTTEANLSHILENSAVDCGEADGRNQLSIDGCHSEEILAVGIDHEIILKKATIDVDALDADPDRTRGGGVDVEYRAGKRVVVSQTEGQLA